jgi:CheY-like chemotaxis protein
MTEPQNQPDRPPRRILVVDDNRDAAEMLGRLLELLGEDVSVVFSGADALEALATFPATVVVLDIGMPGMDGFETGRQIRALPHGGEILLIALTGWGDDETRRMAVAAGFNAHLVKPTDVRNVMALLG